MNTYTLRRRAIATTRAELDQHLARLRALDDDGTGKGALWIRSYIVQEDDGRFGTQCVFQANDVQALHAHAAKAGLPADEIVPVAATVLVRPDAPTRVYVIRRRRFWKTATDLEASAKVSRHVGDHEMSDKVSWIRTYAVSEADGTLGTVCIYQGVDPQALREHAARVGMPADEIVPVVGQLVVRPDPLPAPAAEAVAA
jgi:hypothetical protein